MTLFVKRGKLLRIWQTSSERVCQTFSSQKTTTAF